jgi:uncharacterized protein (TIGR00730 family)
MARDLGALLAEREIELVYGGADVGLMGLLANECLSRGGRVVGVIPKGLFTREVAHQHLTVLHEVGSMHERKRRMYDLADAFVALPGGIGTLEEFAEVMTWTQLGLHTKPGALVDPDGFWDPLLAQLDRMVEDGLLKQANRDLVLSCSTPDEVLILLEATEVAPAEKWITPNER